MNLVAGARRVGGGPGTGPLCPANPQHGRLYDWEDGRWYCPTHSHGGNGKFFTDKEAHGEYVQTDRDILNIPAGEEGNEKLLEIAAQRVIDGKTTLDKAVADMAEKTGRSTATVRESLTLMIDTIQNEGVSVAEKRRQAVKAQATKAAAPKASGRRLEHVEGEEFQKVLKKVGLTSKQAAEATGAAGMGKSATYVYILLHQGASVNLFERFKSALEDYAAKVPADTNGTEAKAKRTATKAAPKAAAVVKTAPAKEAPKATKTTTAASSRRRATVKA